MFSTVTVTVAALLGTLAIYVYLGYVEPLVRKAGLRAVRRDGKVVDLRDDAW